MSGYVTEFKDYLATRTDAPPDFHVHAAMVTLGHAAGSNIYVPYHDGPVYPNMWVNLLARSGMGKSAPLRLSERVLRKAGLGDGLLPESFSQEALLTAISNNANCMFILDEFSAFVRLLERDYNAGSMAWLTSIYGVPEVYKRILLRKDDLKEIILYKPCLSILGASSPDWFAESFKEQQLSGGFLARFLFCPNNTPGEYVEYPGPPDEALETGLAAHLQMVSRLRGMCDTGEVAKIYNDWQRPQRERLHKECPPEFAGMRSRAGLMVWKSCMLFHLSTEPDNLTLRPANMEHAIKYVEHAMSQSERFLTNDVAKDTADAKVLKLVNAVQRHEARGAGSMPWSDALMSTRLSARDMKSTVETAVQSGRLQHIVSGRGYGYLATPKVHVNGTSNGVAH